jgi:hypothetical protein
MLKDMLEHYSASMLRAMRVEQCTYVRYVRTHIELLTFRANVPLVNARGGAEND